jgi:Bacterial protein of unknown function (DUF937)/PRC-barrel domain
MTNIIEAVSRMLTPEIVGKLATASGLDAVIGQKAMGAVVPSILAGLVEAVQKPGGARSLAKAVTDQPADVLTNILGGMGGPAQMAEKGTSLLSSLLSGGGLGILTSTVSRFLGIGEGSTRTLMGLLTPVILGVLGREQNAAHPGAGGLARMLTEQKDLIGAAMPAGLGKLLETSGLSDSIGSVFTPERRTEQVRAAYDQRGQANWTPTEDVAKTGRGNSWAYWVLPLLALGALLWYTLPSGDPRIEPASKVSTRSEPTPKVAAAPDAARTADSEPAYLRNAPYNWVSIGNAPNTYVNQEVFSRTGESLGTVKDVLMGPEGRPAAVIVAVGRALGIGDKDVGLRFSALRIEQRDAGPRIIVGVEKETLQTAPMFEWTQAPKQ